MTTRLSTRLPALAVAAVAAVGLSACSASPGNGTATGTLARSSAAPAATTQVGTVLTANTTDKLGLVVVDGQGYTLYRFDKDTAKPPTSNCANECAQRWPPVLAVPGSPLTVKGVAQDAVGTINRPDGSIQLTLGGWPVYRYSGDTAPGAVGGQGISGTWAAVRPNGGKADAASGSAVPPATAPARPAATPAGTDAGAGDAEPAQTGY